jgi:hypothetical protein
MPKTIDQLAQLLATHGYACNRLLNMLVVSVKTNSYRNPSGQATAEIFCTFEHDCLTCEIPFAFNAKNAAHKDVLYECLLVAAAKTPMLKTQVDPRDGEVRLRVDCPCCGNDGVREDDVIRAVTLLPEFADEWFDEVTRAMNDGDFRVPANAIQRSKSAVGERLDSIVRRAGGVNRLKVLLDFRKRLDQERPNPEENHGDGHDFA